ncbi:hypothetical protein C2G38_2187741 [Gigaspora rosea]|uniref:Uncharacterized protein n=1 Tax=Gigaspora rosea TaxID=44941 RepID=A0A397V5V8_9GLOM|nr:hypothetical protein C2G38_2187741 [Gigaspora rosea]
MIITNHATKRCHSLLSGKDVTYLRKRNNDAESSILNRKKEQRALLDHRKIKLYSPQKRSQEIDEIDVYKWDEKLKQSFRRLPATIDLPFFIIKHEDATLEELEMEKVTVADNLLKKKCRELYWNIVDVSFNTSDFPNFVDTIKTPDLICNEKLKEKASEFGDPNPKTTYLCFTLGEDKGNSPGFPLVLKI